MPHSTALVSGTSGMVGDSSKARPSACCFPAAIGVCRLCKYASLVDEAARALRQHSCLSAQHSAMPSGSELVYCFERGRAMREVADVGVAGEMSRFDDSSPHRWGRHSPDCWTYNVAPVGGRFWRHLAVQSRPDVSLPGRTRCACPGYGDRRLLRRQWCRGKAMYLIIVGLLVTVISLRLYANSSAAVGGLLLH